MEDNKKATIAERGEWINGEWKWSWRWRRAPRGREEEELEDLSTRLQGFSPINNKSDKMEWRLDETKVFSVKNYEIF